MKLYYCECPDAENNAGDIFTPWLLDKMGLVWRYSLNPDLCSTGSILAHPPCKNAKIWGSGFHNEDEEIVQTDISKYYAVRGKLSYQKLGTDKKIAIGDTGILASKYYDASNVRKKYRFGIIPHYVDYAFFQQFETENVHVINIVTPDLDNLFREINECEFIFSSSLHGIIFSHSFLLPAFHIEHGQLVSVDAFKFRNYYSSFGLPYERKIIADEQDFRMLNMESYYDRYQRKEYVFCPTKEQVKRMQHDLLACFPYRGFPWIHNAIFAFKQKGKKAYNRLRSRK